MVVAAAAVVVALFGFYCTGGAWAWTRQAPWYMPCGEAVCVVCHEFATYVHVALALSSRSRSIYTLYTCATKREQNRASTETKANSFGYYLY